MNRECGIACMRVGNGCVKSMINSMQPDNHIFALFSIPNIQLPIFRSFFKVSFSERRTLTTVPCNSSVSSYYSNLGCQVFVTCQNVTSLTVGVFFYSYLAQKTLISGGGEGTSKSNLVINISTS